MQVAHPGHQLGPGFVLYRDAARPPMSAHCSGPRAKLPRTHRDKVLLVRPDSYCAAVCAPGDPADALGRCAALF